MSDEDHILNDNDIAGDFLDTEQSYPVRLEKLLWHLEGYAKPLNLIASHSPDAAEGLAVNAAQQVFVKELINHFKKNPSEEIFSKGGESRVIKNIARALQDVDEYRVFNQLIEHFERKYDRLRSNPVLESYKKLSSQDQRKLIKIAREMENE